MIYTSKLYIISVLIITQKKILLKPNMPDYDQTYRTFSWDKVRSELGISKKVNGGLLALTGGTPDSLALLWSSSNGEKKEFRFSDLMHEGLKVASMLRSKGISPGDRVILISKRVPSLYVSMVGIALTGAVMVPVFGSFGKEAVKYRAENSGAKLAMVHESLKEKVSSLSGVEVISLTDQWTAEGEPSNPEVVSLDHPFVIVYTSGSTGKPKGIWHSHDVMTFYYVSGKYHFDLHKGQDVFWHTGDPAWIAGFAGVWTAWVSGVPLVSYDGRFDPERWLELIQEYRISVVSTAPTALRLIKKAGDHLLKKYDLSSLRFIHAGGEYVDPSLVEWSYEKLMVPVHDGYGQTETATYVIANFISTPIKVGSMGRPLPGVKALIIDESGAPLPPNTPGLLAFVPDFPALARGVWNDDERWKAYFINGYYVTGDRAYVDEDGYFWYLGRNDDVIKVSGYRVSPVEIESILMAHPAVAEAAVIGVPDPDKGNKIKAFVVLKEGVDPRNMIQELKEYVKKTLASHAAPAEIELVNQLPHTLSGKILRRVLRSIESGTSPGDLSTLENQDALNELRKS
jgi:Acyl-coenzyme A synthetases/AMP-(fatty) acid ligases